MKTIITSKVTIALASCSLFFLSLGAPVRANTMFNAASDFSLNSNPNGVWSYGYSTTLGGPFLLYTSSSTSVAGNPDWITWQANIGVNGTPDIFKNTAATDEQTEGANLEPGELALHPGPDGEISIARWTAPGAESISLSTTFTGRDNVNGTTTDVHVFRNGSSLFDREVTGFGPGSDQSFTTSLAVQQGDTIDFAVGFGSDGN